MLLDRVFFKPFKQAYGSASASWMRQNPGARLTDYDVAGLTNIAFTKAARLGIAQSGFRCTGIQPYNRDVFSDLDFLGSALTDIPIEDRSSQSTVQAPSPAAPENEPGSSISALSVSSPAFRLHEAIPTMNIEQIASVPAVSLENLQEAGPSARIDIGNINDVLKVLSPLPDASKKRLTARKRRTQKCEILTSSPYKKELMEKAKDTKAMVKIKRNMKMQVKAKKVASEPYSQHQETECIICGETFDEDWIQCKICEDWAHEACVDINPSDLYYNCDVSVAKKRFGH
ncbi:unnamed protein product [Arctia plantaginis]|uniref:Zinc finger PHD-type domain-containing protein n=1 Tax=Arctia plantaginis TaxID=874455 RepID=A0A8S0ZCU8_ARCPL|nr:unnamed protein product [Arctia plantaginis]